MRPWRTLIVLAWLVVSGAPTQPLAVEVTQAWAPVAKEELDIKDCPGNPGCAAMILYRSETSDDKNSFVTRHDRIKIFTRVGTSYADVEIPYMVEGNQVEEIRARTVQPDGAEVPFEGNIFDRLVVKSRNLKYQAKTFTLPGVVPGCIIEYSYKIRWRGHFPDAVAHPDRYVFQRIWTYPTVHWAINDELFIRKERFELSPLPGVALQGGTTNAPEGLRSHREIDGTIVFEAENILPLEHEELAPPRDEVASIADFYYVVGQSRYATELWGSIFWSDVARTRADELDKFIGKSKAVEDEVKRLVSPGDTMEDRLRKIYQRVQQIRYLSYEHTKTEKERKREDLKENKTVDDILKHGYGEANEINLLFAAMCRAAGIEASVVMVAGRSGRFFNGALPLESQLDSVIVRVRTGNEEAYFDPATLYCPYKMLPWEETGAGGIRLPSPAVASKLGSAAPSRQPESPAQTSAESPAGAGMQPSLIKSAASQLEMPKSELLINTPAPRSDDAIIQRGAKFTLNKDGRLEGTLHLTLVGQEAMQLRLENREEDDAGRRKDLEDKVQAWLPAGAKAELQKASDWQTADRTFEADFHVEIPEYASQTPTRLLFSPAVFQVAALHSFQNSHRVYPVSMAYPYQREDDLYFSLPEGYSIEALPSLQTFKTDFGNYEMTYENQSGVLHIRRKLAMDKYYFSLRNYSALRIFVDRVRIGDEQQAVVKIRP